MPLSLFTCRCGGAVARHFLALCAVFVPLCSPAAPAAAPKPLRAVIEVFIGEMARKHGFEAEALRRAFRQVESRPAVIRAMTAPATAKPWYEFRSRHVTAERIAEGVEFWKRNAVTLARANRDFGVPEEIIVAIIGIETHYGRNTGTFKVLEALATLAFDYPPRAEFFSAELEQYLLLAREEGLELLGVQGSYAGAIGIAQFLPSSYRRYAIDFDGDGRRRLSSSMADAIGSVANYLQAFGWQRDGAIAVAADVGESGIDAVLTMAGLKPGIRIGELRRGGVTPLAPVSDELAAALFSVETETGPRYWLGLQNFYVITRYNRSINYAMAVRELAHGLRAQLEANKAAAQ
ncbi:MAG: lytic murein transglycosylase B [Burkholderiales bacterium]